MTKFQNLEFMIIPEIKVIRIFMTPEDRKELLDELRNNNIKATFLDPKTHLIGQIIEFETYEDLTMFKLKYNQITSEWLTNIMSYYGDYNEFTKDMIECLKEHLRYYEYV